MRFRLRTLLIAFLLLALSAPWWPDALTRFRAWINPPTPKYRYEVIRTPQGPALVQIKGSQRTIVLRARPSAKVEYGPVEGSNDEWLRLERDLAASQSDH